MVAANPSAPAYRLPRVQLFASGVYRGRQWPPSIVDRIAETTRKLGPNGLSLLIPPGVLGHEEEQEWLDATDLPAAGWVDPNTVESVPDPKFPGHKILVGDVVNVPPEVAERLEDGEFSHCSAEIYDDFADDFGHSHGPALRRLAFLGGWVPQVKRLGRLPAPVPMVTPVKFAEQQLRDGSRTVVRFGERTMDRASMIAAVKAAMPGISDAYCEAQSDEQLAELVKNLPVPAPATPAAATPDPTAITPMSDSGVVPMAREELIAALTAAGQDPVQLEGMDDAALQALYDSLGLSAATPTDAPTATMPMSEGETTTETKTEEEKKKDEQVASMGERRLKSRIEAVAKFAEQQHKRLLVQAVQLKRQKVSAFAEQLVRNGIILPVQKPDYIGQLLALDDVSAVHKFSENGRTESLTALDRKMRELEKRTPVVRFGEKVPGEKVGGKPDAEREVREVEKFAETLTDTVLRAGGYRDRAAFVAKFGEAQKKNPSLTAAAYLGTRAVTR